MSSADNRAGGDTGGHNDERTGRAGGPRGFGDAAQQIWLAGLGALAKAQQEGGKLFEALVRQGLESQRRTQDAAGQAQAGADEAAARFAGFASEFGSRAAGQWDKVEELFDARLQRSLDRLRVPTAQDLAALEERIVALEEQLLARHRPGID
ncbi:phasin family protein [Xylophilus sp.]|uniref:phasin family protein n=1 Tax=Xylophilus sp. TaxID=2653893 RepID=UPI0013B7309D|nr:phasin family protein [Xylophilus sp.]KAF1046217.1 MAG: hypothetical protein GAK38_02614 [Xylophilus sp.]